MNNLLNQYEYWKKTGKVTYKHRDTDTTIKIYPLVDTAGGFNMIVGAIAVKNGNETVVKHEGDIDEFDKKLAAWMEDYEVKNQ